MRKLQLWECEHFCWKGLRQIYFSFCHFVRRTNVFGQHFPCAGWGMDGGGLTHPTSHTQFHCHLPQWWSPETTPPTRAGRQNAAKGFKTVVRQTHDGGPGGNRCDLAQNHTQKFTSADTVAQAAPPGLPFKPLWGWVGFPLCVPAGTGPGKKYPLIYATAPSVRWGYSATHSNTRP